MAALYNPIDLQLVPSQLSLPSPPAPIQRRTFQCSVFRDQIPFDPYIASLRDSFVLFLVGSPGLKARLVIWVFVSRLNSPLLGGYSRYELYRRAISPCCLNGSLKITKINVLSANRYMMYLHSRDTIPCLVERH